MRVSYLCLLFLAAVCQLNAAIVYPLKREFRNSNLTFISNESLLLEIDDKSVRFLLTSDFGGMFNPPYSTHMQLQVAAFMGQLGHQLNTHFQFELGDNFYESGVQSLNDTRFNNSFEAIFKHPHLKETPWFLTLGNHDYRGYTKKGNPQAQVDYTFVSKRWILPSFLYSIDIMLRSKLLIKAVIIDTQLICNEGENKVAYLRRVKEKIRNESNSDAPYFLVLGHFPVWSVGIKGTNACMVNRVRPLLKRYNVSGYFAGDEHVMSHFTESDTASTPPIEYVISAASSSMFDTLRNMKLVPPGYLQFHWRANQSQKMNCENCTGAIAVVEANETQILVRFVTATNVDLHSFVILPRHSLFRLESKVTSFYAPLTVIFLVEWFVVVTFVVFKLRNHFV